ncbi:MAG: TonB-dependent receptor plug domain-containing protein, partial [Candidatus Cryptobacteroides sp.]
MKKFFVGLLALVLASPFTSAQQREISGTIKSSADGLPIVGATVHDKSTGQFAISDDRGGYKIFVTGKTVELNVMCLGFKDKVVPATASKIDIVLEPDVMSIDETMVIAYGQGKKSTFTGSASVVKKEELERIPTSNISQALQGLSSGVQVINNSGQPGDGGTILIRGIGSMNASSSPLWVVDGVPYSGYINAIAPSDIESMTVLKDASATALYGSRAANGVII